jgi:hypothetical protein
MRTSVRWLALAALAGVLVLGLSGPSARAQTYYRARVWSSAPEVTSGYYMRPAYPFPRTYGMPGYVAPYTSLSDYGVPVAPAPGFRPYNYHYRYNGPVYPSGYGYYPANPYYPR